MLQAIIDFFIYLLAVYGILSLVINTADSLHFNKPEGNSGLRLAVVVKNREETIEGYIRSLFHSDSVRRSIPDGKLYVIDAGSTDKTPDILDRLKEEHNLEIYQYSEKDLLFEVSEKARQ